MERIPVESANLASVGYDEQQRVLEIEFESGSIYAYEDVPREVYEELMEAGSKGRYFMQNVRDSGYRYRRVG